MWQSFSGPTFFNDLNSLNNLFLPVLSRLRRPCTCRLQLEARSWVHYQSAAGELLDFAGAVPGLSWRDTHSILQFWRWQVQNKASGS